MREEARRMQDGLLTGAGLETEEQKGAALALDPFAGPHGGSTGFEPGRRGLIPRWLPWLVLALMLVFVFVSLRSCSEAGDMPVRMAALTPSDKKAGQLNTQTSPSYQEGLNRYAEARAKDALERGASFVAPAGSAPRQRPRREQEAPPGPRIQEAGHKPAGPAPAEPAVKPRVQEKPGEAPAPDPRLRAYLTSLRQQHSVPQGATLVFNRPAQRTSGHKPPARARPPEAGLPGARVGDILYAVNRVSLDSDAPGPAMAEVVLGPYQGARVIGSFARHNEHLVLTFSELVTRSGASYQIAAYAIDPRNQRTAVRSGVDGHFLERWGGLVAASFLEGFGDAARRSGMSAYSTAYGQGWSAPQYSLSDEAWIAAGKVGERLSQQMEKNFSRPPTVVLAAGTEMGLLLLRVQAKGPGQEAGAASSTVRVRAQDQH